MSESRLPIASSGSLPLPGNYNVAASRALQRLHAIRVAEEQQREAEMNQAEAELHRLEALLENVHRRLLKARALLLACIGTGLIEDRFVALEEIALLNRLAPDLAEKIHRAEQHLLHTREQFVASRIDR